MGEKDASASAPVHRWVKRLSESDLEAWEWRLETDPALIGKAGLSRSAGRRQWVLEVFDPSSAALASLQKEHGGRVESVPPLWTAAPAPRDKPIKIRDRLLVTEEEGEVRLHELRRAWPGREVLSFPPGLAFGTGHHPTTATCLRFLVDVAREWERRTDSWHALDLGCGSGILSVAALRLGARQVDAADFDASAVHLTQRNAERHAVDSGLKVREVDVLAWRAPSAPYPIILANLFSDVLCRAMPLIAEWLEPGGDAILSGILRVQAATVLEAAEHAGLETIREVPMGKWLSLHLRKPA